jgi:hypothetical protein
MTLTPRYDSHLSEQKISYFSTIKIVSFSAYFLPIQSNIRLKNILKLCRENVTMFKTFVRT